MGAKSVAEKVRAKAKASSSWLARARRFGGNVKEWLYSSELSWPRYERHRWWIVALLFAFIAYEAVFIYQYINAADAYQRSAALAATVGEKTDVRTESSPRSLALLPHLLRVDLGTLMIAAVVYLVLLLSAALASLLGALSRAPFLTDVIAGLAFSAALLTLMSVVFWRGTTNTQWWKDNCSEGTLSSPMHAQRSQSYCDSAKYVFLTMLAPGLLCVLAIPCSYAAWRACGLTRSLPYRNGRAVAKSA